MRCSARGVLPAEGIAACFGPSSSGKSFPALDLLAAIASGADWFGKRTKAAPVLYIGLEGEAGISQRVQAYQARHGQSRLTFASCCSRSTSATRPTAPTSFSLFRPLAGVVACFASTPEPRRARHGRERQQGHGRGDRRGQGDTAAPGGLVRWFITAARMRQRRPARALQPARRA
ncbi:MAG: AAA family ATPase [Sulfuritalea sp.]|nr:AAA family ATPase [Sulfuritalea sp.]